MAEAAPSPRSVDELRELLASGVRPKYLFFWGHRPPPGGGVGASCLSQWWPASFEVDGLRYATAEHWMMAGKARLFDDSAMVERVLAAGTPGEAKALGRKVRGFDPAVWDGHRFELVVAGNLAKFDQHPDLREFLLGTGHRVLVEASPVDPVWGIGLAADDRRATDPARWAGLNLLGFALMEVRARLAG